MWSSREYGSLNLVAYLLEEDALECTVIPFTYLQHGSHCKNESNDLNILAAIQQKNIPHLAPNYSVDFYKTKATKCADCEISHEVRRRLVACTSSTLCHIGTFAVDNLPRLITSHQILITTLNNINVVCQSG